MKGEVFEATFKGMQMRKSKHGGIFYYLFFERDGKKYKTMAYEKLRNFNRWKPILNATRGSIVGGLRCVNGTLIDGNCEPKIIRDFNINQFKIGFDD